jgi:hypothetical protein
MAPNVGVQATEIGYGVVQVLRKKITFNDTGNVVNVGKMPPNSHVIGGGVHVTTAFAGGTPTVNIGFIGGTTNAAGYASALTTAAVGYIPMDDLGATGNIMQTVDTTVTVSPAVAATIGEAYVIVMYTTGYPQ